VKKTKSPSLILDAGDAFFRSPFLANDLDIKKAELLLELYKEMGYAAIGVGANDLAASHGFLKKQAKKKDLTFLSANLFFKGKRPFKAYKIIKLNGVRFAVTALTRPSISEKAIDQGLEVKNPEQVLKNLLPKLRKKADVVIVLSNLGFWKDIKFSQQFDSVDIIIGSGRGRLLLRPYKTKTTHVLRTDQKGKSIGAAQLFLSGKKLSRLSNQLVTLRETFPTDADVQRRVDAVKK
jgi:2',3'-cyclic-nucleotide 2'-phosphodiesterase (5'-nucleotidase family)